MLLQLSQATQPPLLLVLDDPTSAQDLNHVLCYCDHCVLMKEGRLSTQGKPGDVLTQDTIEAHWEYRPQLAGHMESIPVFI